MILHTILLTVVDKEITVSIMVQHFQLQDVYQEDVPALMEALTT